MIPQSCCVFPDTLPKDETLFPLVQFFAEAVYIAPVENDLPGADRLPPLARELLGQGLLRFHCPAPLGAEQERFLHLVRELRQRPADFAVLALAGMQEGLSPDMPESGGAILSAVRRRGAAESGRDSLLWRTRLVLKLGESADRQEEEIQQDLRRIARREQSLLRDLREEGQLATAAPETPLPESGSRRVRLRLQAWRLLLACGSQPLPDCALITADRDAFELLLEDSGSSATPVLELPLPAVLAASDFAGRRKAFQQTADGLLSALRRNPAVFAGQDDWNRLLELHYPAAKHGRCLLLWHDGAGLLTRST